MAQKIQAFSIKESQLIKLELVSRLWRKSMSKIVNDLIEKGLTQEAIISQVQKNEAEKLIIEAQLKLLEK